MTPSDATGLQRWLARPATRRGFLVLLLLLLAVISWLALSPAPPRNINTGWDKANHLLAFATLFLVARRAWPGRGLQLAGALLVYGGLIEILQMQVPGRSGEWPDLLADGLGLGLAALLELALRRLLARRAPTGP